MRNLFTTIFIFISCLTYGQYQDVGVWTGLKISQKIDKKGGIIYTQGFRYDDNISNLANMYSQVKGSYSITDFLKFSMAYRWAQKQAWRDDLKIENRYQFDLQYKFEKKDLEIKNRVRFQSKYSDFKTTEYGYIPKNVTRNETAIEYSITKKIKPYISFEFFYPVNSDFNTIDKLRYQMGSSFDVTKSISADLFFIIQKDINQNNPLTSYITGVSLSYDLPKIKTKKKKDKDKNEEKKGDDTSKKKKESADKPKKEVTKKAKPTKTKEAKPSEKEEEEDELYFPDLD